jgi:lipopolysaccharide/colanic/teichoic acid biosynthesis glycosyltransferase
VKSGIIGWAQFCYPCAVAERNATEKLQYDLYCGKNCSLFLDLMILLKTLLGPHVWSQGALTAARNLFNN